MNSICGIYKITSPSKKVYIGQAVNIHNRWLRHKNNKESSKQPKLNNSFLKYGVENHLFEIIETCEIDELNCKERYWQDFYDVLNGGLNCILQECGESRRVISQETRDKISKASKGKTVSEVTKQKLSAYRGELGVNWGKKLTQEHKDKIKANCCKLNGEEHWMYGKTPPNSRLVMCTQTGVIYNSVREAAYTYNINKGTLWDYLHNKINNKTSLIFI